MELVRNPRETFATFCKSIISGLLIALGCAVNAKVGGIVGAVLFSCGLVTIIQFRLPLFTGIVAEVMPVTRMLMILAGNVLGGLAGHFLWSIEIAPVSSSLLQIFLGGIGTGILMVAAYKSKSFLVAMLGVALFIMSGFPHCIAEAGYLRMNLLQWLLACAGNIVGGQIWRALDLPTE